MKCCFAASLLLYPSRPLPGKADDPGRGAGIPRLLLKEPQCGPVPPAGRGPPSELGLSLAFLIPPLTASDLRNKGTGFDWLEFSVKCG